MTTDLTFITNEGEENLLRRFASLIKDTRYFDCLVGYFFTSGFYAIYKSLETTEKIRILIGIKTNLETFKLIQEAKKEVQKKLAPSHKEVKEEFDNRVIKEMESSDDTSYIEEGIKKFIEWIGSGKLEIKVYPEDRIHAKVYIMTFREGDRDVGRVITGSSNFTKAGLKENIEFNVELKNRSDYEFASKKFKELWENAVDVSKNYIETIKNRTWMNESITPFELYLKFLYEFLKEKINLDQDELFKNKNYLPEDFMDLEYQKDAVKDAKMKLEEFRGVFLSDVPGLGKTYIAAMLANQLDGRNLVIAPPALLNKDNPGTWPNVFSDFGVRQTDFESYGNLDKLIERDTEKYKNVFIDEAHIFRTETTQMYEKLFQICRGKKIILVSATPLNNRPEDILSQIKLFQNAHKSTLPNPKVRNLEKYFASLKNKLKGLDRKEDRDEYLRIVQENAKDIRENILQYLMVRRTRNSIKKYYSKDLENQKLKFPEVTDPERIVYRFDKKLDKIFNETLELIVSKFKYARYAPLMYLKEGITQPEEMSQKNMIKFMKVLLVKRLESSFYAFSKTIERFIYSYNRFIEEYKKGHVYVSKKYINKIFEFLENDDISSIHKLIDEDKAQKYSANDFEPSFIKDLESDFDILKKINSKWSNIKVDPKINKFIEILTNDNILKKNKLLVFTESKETAEYIGEKLNPKFDNKVLVYFGGAGEDVINKVIQNFNPKVKNQKDDYRILVSTEILGEGVNLHRSNVVINYDLPWNTAKMMQRVGRINRVDTKFDKIYTYNFFPAGPIEKNIGLEDAMKAKLTSFIEMLGNDARFLTDEEIKSHDLFMRLTSRKTLTEEDQEDDVELKFLTYLREIRDSDKSLFEKIKALPKKARTAVKHDVEYNSVITFFRKGKFRKIFQAKMNEVEEVDFAKAVEILKADKDTKRESLDGEFYKHLEANKKAFESTFVEEDLSIKLSGGRSGETQLVKKIKAVIETNEVSEDEDYLQSVLALIMDGALPRATIKKLLKITKKEFDPHKIVEIIRNGIPKDFFKNIFVYDATESEERAEIILSEYLIRR